MLDDAHEDAMHDVLVKAAVDLVNDVAKVLEQPALDPMAVSLKDFRGVDVGFYDAMTRDLTVRGFRHLRDLDGTPLLSHGSPPTPIRVLLDEAGVVSAALYHVRPKSPGFFVKLLLVLLRKWPPAPRVAELTTYFDDAVVTTANQGELNTFAHPPWVTYTSLPLGAPLDALFEAHRDAVLRAAGGRPPRSFAGFEEVDAARDAFREKANVWRRRVSLMPDELDRLLAPHGDQGVKLRPYIERELYRRFPMNR